MCHCPIPEQCPEGLGWLLVWGEQGEPSQQLALTCEHPPCAGSCGGRVRDRQGCGKQPEPPQVGRDGKGLCRGQQGPGKPVREQQLLLPLGHGSSSPGCPHQPASPGERRIGLRLKLAPGAGLAGSCRRPLNAPAGPGAPQQLKEEGWLLGLP